MKKIIVFLSLVLGIVTIAGADTITLKNGKSYDGTFQSKNDGVVSFKSDGIVLTIPEDQVKGITMSGGATVAALDKKKAAGSVTVPAGITIHVRTKDVLSTDRHGSGHKFTAILEADLVHDGVAVAARGATIYGILTDVKQAGRVVGKSEMTIAFTGIMINNQIKPLKSGKVTAVAKGSSGGQTVSRTARGAAIGGMIDGKSGARTGAKVGVGLALLTKGDSISIPAGTLLDFPLAAPFTP